MKKVLFLNLLLISVLLISCQPADKSVQTDRKEGETAVTVKEVAKLETRNSKLETQIKAPADIKYNKSWIYIGVPRDKKLVSGDKLTVTVEYYIDGSEFSTGISMYLRGLGPWVTSLDAKTHHIGYPNMSQIQEIEAPGKGVKTFTFTVPPGCENVKRNNRLLFLASFRGPDKKGWPWQVRANTSFETKHGLFVIDSDVPGNLFTYDEPVIMNAILKNVNRSRIVGRGNTKTLMYRVRDHEGAVADEGSIQFKVEKEGQKVPVKLNINERGTFVIEMDIVGWEKHFSTFARIPDIAKITQGRPTRFGFTSHESVVALSEEICAANQRLGMSYCRRFSRWYRLAPGPGVYKLDELEEQLERSQKYGINTWICIVGPPAHVLKNGGRNLSYTSFEADMVEWGNFVKAATTRLKGKFYGWEWDNEINPGGAAPIEAYMDLVRVGYEAAKPIYPEFVSILAGGLYPRSYRLQYLTAGIGKYIDALPVHYQNGDGILEAREDLDNFDHQRIEVWEDESGKGSSVWGLDPMVDLKSIYSTQWVLKHWTDELAAGCKKIIYFGGESSASGGAGYFHDDKSPRPLAATLAVFTSKLFEMKPLGIFMLGNGGWFHLFEKDGKALLVASTYEKKGERLSLNVGTERVRITDYQGREQSITTTIGKINLSLKPLRFYLEDADLDVLKAYVIPEIKVARVGAGTSANVARARRTTPRVSIMKGQTGSISVIMRNLYDRELSGNITVKAPESWGRQESSVFSLKAGERIALPVKVAVPETAKAEDYKLTISFKFNWDKLPVIEKPVIVPVLSPDMIGNLMPNGDFETADASGKGPEGWKVNGTTKLRFSSEGLGMGLGKYVLKFQDTKNKWEHCSRTIPLREGETYLYTAWLWNKDMGAGSNMTQNLTDGTSVRLYDQQVFTAGSSNEYWQMFICRKQMPLKTKDVAHTPVVNGTGWALFDNIRVTLYEGTDYTAESYKAPAKLKLDGNLDEWNKTCPIPLIGKNQLSKKDDSYKWSPQNLNGVGYLMWDDSNLYIGLEVMDDVHHAKSTGNGTINGDSLIISFDPTNKAPDADTKSFAYYISTAPPGGGSGHYTIYRPGKYSAGLSTGQLAKDSSIYEMGTSQKNGKTIYEIKMPFSELGGISPVFGGKFGLSIQLNDNDGQGMKAHMNWGGGLSPSWSPKSFGLVTFIE